MKGSFTGLYLYSLPGATQMPNDAVTHSAPVSRLRHWSSCQKRSGETGPILLVNSLLGLPIRYPDPTSVSHSGLCTESTVSTTMLCTPIASHHHFYLTRCENRCFVLLLKCSMCCRGVKWVPTASGAGGHRGHGGGLT